MTLDQGQTVDSILGGALTVVQPASGFRFAIDSILLARFVRPRQRDRILELGAGCGVVSIVLAVLHHPSEIAAVELQPRLAGLIAHNAVLNGAAAVTAICADIRRPIPGLMLATFDCVVLNPPYRAASRGRESPNPDRRTARGGEGASLTDFIEAAARYANHGGRIAIVFTASRTAELIALMKQRLLEPKRIRFVHSKPQESATMVLLEARKAGGLETTIEPPLFIFGPSGDYTDEARAILTRAE
jgi:tRNA1Val (adenine37-N6)-methyltransferase